MKLETIRPLWKNELCIVAATGPSLTPEVAAACQGRRTIAVCDAYRLMPESDILYACDAAWWLVHEGCPTFKGEKWSCRSDDNDNAKLSVALQYGLRLIESRPGDIFSPDPSFIYLSGNSGFQAINLALLLGANPIVLVGFDMRTGSDGKRHFFGDHPAVLTKRPRYEDFIPNFITAAKVLPSDRRIINCTPGSALRCFEMADLANVLA